VGTEVAADGGIPAATLSACGFTKLHSLSDRVATASTTAAGSAAAPTIAAGCVACRVAHGCDWARAVSEPDAGVARIVPAVAIDVRAAVTVGVVGMEEVADSCFPAATLSTATSAVAGSAVAPTMAASCAVGLAGVARIVAIVSMVAVVAVDVRAAVITPGAARLEATSAVCVPAAKLHSFSDRIATETSTVAGSAVALTSAVGCVACQVAHGCDWARVRYSRSITRICDESGTRSSFPKSMVIGGLSATQAPLPSKLMTNYLATSLQRLPRGPALA
jgi:hypothetical protein